MWPGEVLSDLDLDEEPIENLRGRHDILQDLYAEFQGASGAYGVFAVAVPAIIVVCVSMGWAERPTLALTGAAALFVAMASISAYSLVWYIWVRNRLNRVRHKLGR